jgi:ribonuclease D
MTEYQFIDSDQDLQNTLKIIESETTIYLDTEFVRDFHYTPVIGLIQIGTKDQIFLFDSIKCDVKPLLPILENPNILKIMHSATQDCDVFYKNFEMIPKPIFDTQIAASVLGIGDNISYQKLVKRFAKVTLEKDTKLTNWSKRPLNHKQLSYAANDVKHLEILRTCLSEKLKDQNRKELFQEESNTLYENTLFNNNPLNAWTKISGTNKVPYYLNYLRHYAAIREKLCKKRNKIKRNLISDDLLVELAKLQPKAPEDIKQHRLLVNKLEKKLWPEFIKISEKIKAANEDELVGKRKYILNSNQEIIFNFLKLILNYFSNQSSIAPRILATSDELKQYIKEGDARFMHGIRYDIFGIHAQKLMEGKLRFSIKDGNLDIDES